MATNLTPILQYYAGYKAADNGHREKQGEADGKQDIPPSDATEFHNQELQIFQQAQTAINEYDTTCDQEIGDIVKKIENNDQFINDPAQTKKRADILTGFQNKTSDIEGKWGTTSPRYRHLEAAYGTQEDHHRNILLDVGNRALDTSNRYLYLMVMTVLSIVEVPINKMAFDNLWAERGVDALTTYPVAFAVGLFFVLVAHMSGMMLRTTGGEPGQKQPKKQYPVIAGLTILVIVLMYFLAILRTIGIDAAESGTSITATLADNGIQKVLSYWKLSPEGWTLLLLNLAVLVAGLLLSFYRHDPHPLYEKVLVARNRLQHKMRKMEVRDSKEKLMAQGEYNTKIDAMDKHRISVQQTIATLTNDKEKMSTTRNANVDMVKQIVYREMLAYQHGNERSRSSPVPSYFGSNTQRMLSDAFESAG